MARWSKRTFKLPENHGWKTQEGFNAFVADRGAVRLDFPAGWIIKPTQTSIRFHDQEPPDDRCVVEMSYLHLKPFDYSGLPVAEMVRDACAHQGHPVEADRIVRVTRQDLDLAWAEWREEDPNEHRDAVHRICLARTANALIPHPSRKDARLLTRPIIQALITAAFWPEDGIWFEPIWSEILRSLQLGMPTGLAGPRTH